MSSSVVTPPVVKARAINCPNCGSTVQLRGFAHTLTATCGNCLTVIDASDPTVGGIALYQQQMLKQPLIPMGSRCKIQGWVYEVIGFQTRAIEVDGVEYTWDEYVLFNPYRGFRYLTEYQGHWNFVTTLKALPAAEVGASGRPEAAFGNDRFKHFQQSSAVTKFVIGEFPWKVGANDPAVTVDDYVSPPLMLSSEKTANEVTWSIGQYMTGKEVWKAFEEQGTKLPQGAPKAEGVFANQVSPYKGSIGSIWRLMFLGLGLLILLGIIVGTTARRQEIFRQKFSFSSQNQGEPSFVTQPFEIKGKTPSTVEVTIRTDLNQNWAYFAMALINDETGDAYDFGREVGYYYGSDSDGSWTEGDRTDDVLLPSIPPGRYYLRVEPEMDKQAPANMNYEIILRHDVPSYVWLVFAGLLLLIPPIWYAIRAGSFEAKRWAESGYSGGGSSSDDDSEGSDDE
jgi:hypothetical protein